MKKSLKITFSFPGIKELHEKYFAIKDYINTLFSRAMKSITNPKMDKGWDDSETEDMIQQDILITQKIDVTILLVKIIYEALNELNYNQKFTGQTSDQLINDSLTDKQFENDKSIAVNLLNISAINKIYPEGYNPADTVPRLKTLAMRQIYRNMHQKIPKTDEYIKELQSQDKQQKNQILPQTLYEEFAKFADIDFIKFTGAAYYSEEDNLVNGFLCLDNFN